MSGHAPHEQQLSGAAPARVLPAQVILVLVVAVLGILIGRASAAQQDGAVKRPTAPAATSTRAGAVVSAIGYLSALRWDVLVDEARRERTIARYATPDAASQLDADLAAPAELLRAAVTRPPVLARSAVLGYRVDRFEADRATVSVWGMALFGTGTYEPVTQWSTSRVELVWSSNRWLVAGVRSNGGPSPDSSLRALARAQRTFREVRHAP